MLFLAGVSSINLGFILDYIYQGEVNLYQEQLDSFLESAQKLEIEGLLGGDNEDNVDGGKNKSDEKVQFERYTAELVQGGSLMKMDTDVRMNPKRQYRVAQTDVTKLDVGSMTSEEVEEKRKELYQRIDGGWRCLACAYTSTSIRSSQIRLHVETHIDGLSYTCDICNKEFRSRYQLYDHSKKKCH